MPATGLMMHIHPKDSSTWNNIQKLSQSQIMDRSMYDAATNGNMEDGDFSLAEHLNREVESGYQVTSNGNTILHMATLFGQRGFVAEVLKIIPGLLRCKNFKEETALHIAANAGQSDVVSELLSIRGEEAVLVRMTDAIGDTALHKAVRGGHFDIVKKLVKLLVDSKLDFPANMAGETPLYLAAESDFPDALNEILNVCKEPTYVAGPYKRTPLHAAVIQEHKECARLLWQWNKQLCEVADEWGWNSLHYAVKQGLEDQVSDMLGWNKSLAYSPAGSENDWTTAFHIAASEGDILMIHELLNHCPDCWQMVNSKGQNALHVAILHRHDKLVNVLLRLTSCSNLVDEADNEGNTPLHLLASHWNHVPQLILDHPRAKKMAFNKQNQTPLDLVYSLTWAIKKEKLVADLSSINGQLGQREFKVKRKKKTLQGKIRQMRNNDNEERAKRDKIAREKAMKVAQIHAVVATLVMTVTFAAAFTLPGGLESNDGPNKGMAILLKKAAFRAFVISDVLAFACSASAVFIYFVMAGHTVGINDRRLFSVRCYGIAAFLQVLAMVAVVVAFVTGLYATLENSLPLAVSVCVIGCGSFLSTYFDISWHLLL